ncbi:ABC1-like kinase [Tanacetum coccineum]
MVLSWVLTIDWVEGVKLNEQAIIEGQGLKVLDLVNTGIRCNLRQLLEYGYLHVDPHPGNLLATPDGKLAFLNFGMMSETPKEARSLMGFHCETTATFSTAALASRQSKLISSEA